MHRLKVSLLCLLSFTLAGSVFGQTAPQPDTGGTAVYDSSSSGVSSYNSYSGGATYGRTSGAYFNARYFSGNGVGYQQGYQQYGGFVPFWLNDDFLIGPDLRMLVANTGGVGGNFGGVGRKYFSGADRIVGAAAYFDTDTSANRNRFNQGTFGLETLGQYWDLRGNYYYAPGNQDKFVGNGSALCVSGDPFFSGNNIVFQGQQGQYREQAMSGFDLEFGAPIFPSTPWLRGYVGTYYYKANQVAPPMSVTIPDQTDSNPWGFRGHLDAWIADDLLVGVNVTTDPVWGTNVNGMVDFRFSGFKPTRYFPQWTTRERMLAPWQRNWRIAVEQYQTAINTDVVAINPNTGKPYFVSFVNGDNPNAGTGTYEDPFQSFDHPNGISGADIIYVARDGSTEANPYIGTMKLFDNQILLGEGGTMTPLPLSATYGNCSVNGNFTLPGMDGSGNYPWVSSPGGHAIGLANNNEVSGFHIINSVDGIIGTNIDNANLRNLDIHNNSGRGINLTNVGGNVDFLDVNSSNNGTGIFMSETTKTLVSTFTNVTASNNTGNGLLVNGTGGSVTLSATDPTKPFTASGNGSDNAAVNMTGGTFLGNFTGSTFNNSVNGSGFAYNQAGGSGTLNLTDSKLNTNGLDGLNLAASAGGSLTANTTNSQLTGNTRDGIHSVATSGATITTSDTGSAINTNGRDGYFYDLSGNSVLNATFLNDSLVSNTRSAFFGLMNNSTATFNATNTLATNSGQNGFALDANNNSVFTGTTSGLDLSNSGANGMNVTLHTLSNATFNMTGTTDSGNTQNGVSFLADNSTFSLTALGSTFDDNGVNGIVGTAQNSATANIDVSNASSISGNAQNGVFVTTTGLSNVNATFASTAIDNNLAGNGVRLSMDNSPNSTLAMSGTTTLNNNGANGLLIDATTNTVFTPTLTGTTIQGNGGDGIQINVASGSSVGTAINAGTLTNLTVTGNAGNGFDVDVTGANSTSTLMVTNANAAGNTGSNALLTVEQGGFLNFVTSNSDFSSSVTGAGVDITVSDVNSTAYVDLDSATIDGNSTVGINAVVAAPAPGVGQNGASLNVCLDDSTVSNNTLQGISIAATGAGATASFGVGQYNMNNGSTIANNGSEGVLGNASSGGTINFRQIGSHFDNNGQTVTAAGLNFGANAGTIRTLMYGGTADNNSGDGLRVGPISPNVSTNNSDLTVSLANGFSGSNNGGYGLVLDGSGANSANLLQDPNTPPAVFTGNGAGSQNINFAGANQVVLQELGSFSNSAGDGAVFNFSNINTAIISFNGLGTGTISNNAGNGLLINMNNVQNGSVLVTGYTDISNNGGDGIQINMTGASAANPMNAAIEIDGVAGLTNMDSNGANAINIQLANAQLVNNFASLNGVALSILTPTDNDSFNACIPVPVSQAGGLAGLTPATSLNINDLNITNTTQQGIVVAGTNTTIAAGASISNNTVDGSLGGDGITVTLNETSPRTVANADGFTFSGNTVTNNTGNGITFGVTNTGISTVTSANNLSFANNTVSTNGGDGINLNFSNAPGSTATINNWSFTGDTIDGNTGNGVNVTLSGLNVASTMTNETITNNTLDGLLATLNGTGAANQTKGDFTLTGSTVTGNGTNGAEFIANSASNLGVSILGNTLIDSNEVDGVLITATNANTTVTGTVTGSNLTNNGAGGTGNGLTGNFDSGATGAFTIDTSTFGNTAAVGGTQINGLELNVNQNAVATATNVTATITNSNFTNNEVSGIAGNISGNNGGLNPTTGAQITLDTVTVSGNLGNGLAFVVDNAALLQMSVDNSTVTTNGQNGMFVNANDVNTLVALDMSDSAFNNNGTIIFPGDGFNATIDTGATLNVCVETTGAGVPMSFSGNTGDGFDVLVNGAGSRSDIDFHSVIAGLSAADGLLGNTLNGVTTNVFDGGELNFRSYTSKFDGNGGAGLLGVATNTTGVLPQTVGRYRIIGGSADGNTGDGFSFSAVNTVGAPPGGTELTAQFQADDLGNGISAQNNGGYGLEYVTTTPGGGINANLLMTGGSQLLNNGAGTLNVNMAGADQAIIGLSGTFNGSTTGDGIHIDLSNITGLALVSLQGPGEVSGNAGDGIDVSMTNVAQGGVFIGGFTDVSNNGTGNDTLLGQDGIKVTMDSVALGAISINGETASLPGNVMNVSNNTGNGVNVTAQNGSVIDNAGFNAILGAQLVSIIDYTPPDVPCPTPLPNPLLTTTPTNVTTALGITFPTNLTVQNLNVDNNGNATAGNLNGSGIVVNVDNSQVVGGIDINNNIITNTGAGVAATTHNGVTVNLLGGANVTAITLLENQITGNKGDGFNMLNPYMTTTPLALNFTRDTITNNSVNGVNISLPNASLLNPTLDLTFTNTTVSNNVSNGVQLELAGLPNSSGIANVNILSDNTTANPTNGLFANQFNNNGGMGMYIAATNPQQTNTAQLNLFTGGTGGQTQFTGNVNAGMGINLAGEATVGNFQVSNIIFSGTTRNGSATSYFNGDGLAVYVQGTTDPLIRARFDNATIGDAALKNTTFSGNAGSGIHLTTLLSGSSDLLTIQNATLTNNTLDGIEIERNAAIQAPGPYITNVSIDNNSITSNRRNGINIASEFADGADTYWMSNNTITNNTTNGIRLFTQADADLTVVIGQTRIGNLVAANTISNNGGDGINVTQNLGQTDLGVVTGTVVNNQIKSNTGNGINVNGIHHFDIGTTNGTTQASNVIDLNGLAGINIDGASLGQAGSGAGATPTLSQDRIMFNSIQQNVGNGITITSEGFENVQINNNFNTFAAVGGLGNVAGINYNGGNGIQLDGRNGFLLATVGDTSSGLANDVLHNGNNGVVALNGNGNDSTIQIENNNIQFSGFRGVNILNASNSNTGSNNFVQSEMTLTMNDNIITNSQFEGVYIVNTTVSGVFGASTGTAQGTDALANTAMVTGNTWFNDPRLALNINDNLITSNGQIANGNLYNTTGLVVRVGTSDATSNFRNNGGLATGLTSAQIAAGVTSGDLINGGVVANVTGNTFGGNFGSDVTFNAFNSTNAPPTTTGSWLFLGNAAPGSQFWYFNGQDNDPNANAAFISSSVGTYVGDPLARLDLNFTGNNGDGIIATRTDVFSSANAAYYNNAEGTFKSRINNQPGGANDTAAGPFISATRSRNATRLASLGTVPNGSGNPTDLNDPANGFLYTGTGTSTFRVNGTGDSANSFADDAQSFFGPSFTPLTPGTDSTTFAWDSF